MKKILVPILILMFFVISCHSSKKAENNDADILPDEDVADVDENDEDDEDEESTEYRSSLINICTGQTKCYDNEKEIDCLKDDKDFYGQDAQNTASASCVPQNFKIDNSVEDEPTVIDKNTGLEWQQKFSPLNKIYDDISQAHKVQPTYAEDYCENIEYGGHDDWRLPTIQELNSIVDRSKNDPAINTDYFTDTLSKYFWSSSRHVPYDYNLTYMLWSIDFKDGTVDLESFDYLIESNAEHYVRCVRGEKSAEINPKYRDLGNSEIIYLDSKSPKSKIFLALFYEPIPDWENALKYCENKTYGGLSTWRLPNINELAFLFLDNSIWLHDKKEIDIWSSTSYTKDPTKSWILKRDETNRFFIVPASKKSKTSDYYTLCVSDSPCEGDAAWNGTECIDLCDPDPCKDMEHSTGKCIQSYSEVNGDKYQCECVENAVWDGYIREQKCITPCDPNPCENEELSTGVCSIVDYSDEFYKCECVKENHYWCQGRCTDGSDGSCN